VRLRVYGDKGSASENSERSTTDEFLAFRRFITRRDILIHVYSNNATNFNGANNHLKKLHALFKSNKYKNHVNRFSIKHHITWHFIPRSSIFQWTVGVNREVIQTPFQTCWRVII